jgi:6-phosphogluconolactonase/glucosamine-6-phosphate isomerase/deaminase
VTLPVIVAEDPAAEAAARIVAALRNAIASGRRAAIALSGGETPWRTIARFGPDDLDWSLIDVFQVDERIVPADHPDRNLRRLREVLTVPAVIHPMPVESPDLDRTAAEYAASLPGSFDLVQLGLGADGHTASLVPNDPVLDASTPAAVTLPYPRSTPAAHPRESGDPEPGIGSLLSQGRAAIGGRLPGDRRPKRAADAALLARPLSRSTQGRGSRNPRNKAAKFKRCTVTVPLYL